MKTVILPLLLMAIAVLGVHARNKDCRNVWEFSNVCEDEMINSEYKEFPKDSRSYKLFKKCARAAVKKVMKKYQERCIDPEECESLGENAANIIAYNFCYWPYGDSSASQDFDYMKTCHGVAIRACQGDVSELIDMYCGYVELDIFELEDQQLKCEEVVSDMVGYYGDI